MTNIGVVVIGRNEGERLRRCLQSITADVDWVVYVDSGSTDGSVEHAREVGVEVVELDMSLPFTAARARNTGYEQLMKIAPGTQFVQFADGDVQLAVDWLNGARRELARRSDLGAVCGRLHELNPQHSVYNRLCDIEWNTPTGEAETCGGVFMIRASAFGDLDGFKPSLIAGEEPELCVRLRQGGWRIWRLDADMGWHDAAMMRFSQWWQRTVRSGHAYTEGAWLHGWAAGQWCLWRPVASAVGWMMWFPVSVGGAVLVNGWIGMMLLVYPIQALRIARRERGRAGSPRAAVVYGMFTMLGKFAQCIGAVRFALTRCSGRRSRIIEYKDGDHSDGGLIANPRTVRSERAP